MKSFAYVFATFLVHVPLSACADAADIDDCKRIGNETQRLACYDELFQSGTADAVGHTDSETVTDEARGVSADPEPVPTAVPATFIEARLVGDFNGWSGKTVFTLDNGQVWQQTNNYIRDYKPRSPIPQPKVTISKGMIGSYNMRVEGVKRIVQVKRVK